MPPDALVQTLVFSRSYLHRQMSPPDSLVVKGGTTWTRNGRWILPENARLPRSIQVSFICRKCTTWDKRLYFPFEGRRAEDFFSPWKIRRLWPGLNPWTWLPVASTLHRSRLSSGLKWAKKKIWIGLTLERHIFSSRYDAISNKTWINRHVFTLHLASTRVSLCFV